MAENKFKRPIMAPGFLNPDGTPYDPSSGDGYVTTVNGKPGPDVTLTASDVGALPDSYTPPAPTWDEVTGKPSTFPTNSAGISDASTVGREVLTAADAAAARTAIGAGTSNLTLGTTAQTALAGNGKAASAAEADKLTTARAINGHNFDGTAPITIGPDDIQVAAFQSAGGNVNFPGGTLAEALQAIVDQLDPGA